MIAIKNRRATSWVRGTFGRKGLRSYRVRALVQAGFALLCLAMGTQLALFYNAALAGDLPLPYRPPGVEGFLPISGLMGIFDWFYQGSLNSIHPAATVIVLITFAIALLFRKAFCSWICPIGFASDLLARLGRKIFGRNFRPWKWLDIPLQGLKYLLMAFFVWAVVTMSAEALQGFIESPYNRVADIKMGLFFVRLTWIGVTVMVVLAVLSTLIQGFWCRYLCPYGALLGLFSWASPAKIRRDETLCTDCSLCDRVCPSRLPVSSKKAIHSQECTACLDCVASCPAKGALVLQTGNRSVGPVAFAASLVLLFLAGYVGARASGLWHNEITDVEYVERIRDIDAEEYGHPGESVPADPAADSQIGSQGPSSTGG